MHQLNLPDYNFRIQSKGEKKYIFDRIRRRYVLLTPEEWVRQNFMLYLISEKQYPGSLMAVEKQISINGMLFRFDLMVYNRTGLPHLIAEFKAPTVEITQQAFDQVVRYNMAFKVEIVVVSNGMQHFACRIDYPNQTYSFLQEVPLF
ncbi:MAG: type I restriction enzyme HsdR N-terminal domain-containing protein [Bacteroidota bacterium]